MNYNFYDVTGSFQGTQSSNSGVYSTYETVTIGVPDNSIGTYTVEYVKEGKKTTSLFDDSKLKEKDKYQVFLGGNFAQVDITTTAGTGRNLMIIKDSYANCFIPLLTPYYDKIIVIDPRYFYDDIYTLIEAYGISDVLFMYNVNSYVEDNSLEDILSKSVKSRIKCENIKKYKIIFRLSSNTNQKCHCWNSHGTFFLDNCLSNFQRVQSLYALFL